MTHATTSEFTVYGIKNCDTVRKARRFLEEQGVSAGFHDFRQDGIDAELIDNFIRHLGVKALLNTRGTTWRTLPDEVKAQAEDVDHVRQIMLTHPAVIKRPVLVRTDGQMVVGFDLARWQEFLTGAN